MATQVSETMAGVVIAALMCSNPVHTIMGAHRIGPCSHGTAMGTAMTGTLRMVNAVQAHSTTGIGAGAFRPHIAATAMS